MLLEWTEPALADLEAIRDFIGRDSTVNAERFIERLFDAADSLTAHPHLGRQVPEAAKSPEDVRELIFRDYRILYWVQPDRVQVLAVVHGARNLHGTASPPWE